MRVLYVMPEFDEGGAEVHVLNLIRGMSSRGHEITLASSGGRLEAELPPSAKILHIPSQMKNPITIMYCALKIALMNLKYHWDVIHAHSRVPAWVSWIASKITGAKFIVTAHALYSLNFGLTPLKHADGLICISSAVRNHLKKYVPDHNIIIANGIIPPEYHYKDFPHDETKFLIAGRLTHLKGIDTALNALAKMKCYSWELNIVGEGSERARLQDLSLRLGISERVIFHGDKSRNDVDKFMAMSSCLLFPSTSEGMGLVVLEALRIGLPVIASDLEALREFSDGGLVMAGNVEEWREAIESFILAGKSSPLRAENVITVEEMSVKTEEFYGEITAN